MYCVILATTELFYFLSLSVFTRLLMYFNLLSNPVCEFYMSYFNYPTAAFLLANEYLLTDIQSSKWRNPLKNNKHPDYIIVKASHDAKLQGPMMQNFKLAWCKTSRSGSKTKRPSNNIKFCNNFQLRLEHLKHQLTP